MERTFASMVATMDPSPVPSFAGVEASERASHLAKRRAGIDAPGADERLGHFADSLVEASVPEVHKVASTSVAVDWSDHASWSRPASPGEVPADADASWGHRNTNTPGTKDGLFFGYYGQAVTMVSDEGGPGLAELVRRVCLESPRVDPPTTMASTLAGMVHAGVALGDVLADSGYAYRLPERWAGPLARLGARLASIIRAGSS